MPYDEYGKHYPLFDSWWQKKVRYRKGRKGTQRFFLEDYMTLYSGPAKILSNVHIGQIDPVLWPALQPDPDLADSFPFWYTAAATQREILYFGIYHNMKPVGQIFLHDIDLTAGESLVGYHLFRSEDRGQGTGTKALRLLQEYVTDQTVLARLIIITSLDNLASQAIAKKCDFLFRGGAREDPENLVVFQWDVLRT